MSKIGIDRYYGAAALSGIAVGNDLRIRSLIEPDVTDGLE